MRYFLQFGWTWVNLLFKSQMDFVQTNKDMCDITFLCYCFSQRTLAKINTDKFKLMLMIVIS